MKDLSVRDMEWLAHSHPAGTERLQQSNAGSPVARPVA